MTITTTNLFGEDITLPTIDTSNALSKVYTAAIYHIHGVKVGCTNDIPKRMIANFSEYDLSPDHPYDILETATGTLSYIADREEYYSLALGYGPIPQYERYDSILSQRNHDSATQTSINHSRKRQTRDDKKRAILHNSQLRAHL